MITKNLIILFLFFTLTVIAQPGVDNILNAYPNWKTNFNVSSIELTELLSGGPPKDGIPAINNPIFTTITEAGTWLNENEPVISVSINGISKAYPLQILLFHEIVNDRIGRTPLLVSFCPLCYSGIVFNRRINKKVVNFGVSGLLRNSDMVMYDDITESFWQQFTGEAIVGDLTGNKLEVVQSQIISFKQFTESYADGLVLSKNTEFKRPYGMNPYVNYDNVDSKPFLFTGEKDKRLLQNEKVIGIKLPNFSKAYPYSITFDKKVLHDKIENQNIVIFHLPGTKSSLDNKYIEYSKDVGSTGVFSPTLEGSLLSFIYQDGIIKDTKTNSTWNITGTCVEGKLKGSKIIPIPHGDYFSFAWFAFMPNSIIFSE